MVSQLLHEWRKLSIDEKGLLVRKHGGNVQVVLSKKFRTHVYQELHEKMGHLNELLSWQRHDFTGLLCVQISHIM